jgi:hypothetical protein
MVVIISTWAFFAFPFFFAVVLCTPLLSTKELREHVAASPTSTLFFCFRLLDSFHAASIVQDAVVFVAQHLSGR